MTSDQLFWVTSRAGGVVALLAASLAVTAGLLMGGRFVPRSVDLRVVHETLSLTTLAAIAVHALALLGDSFVNLSLTDILIPFASSYQRVWMAIGISGGWMLTILGLSYYARARIGVARWRKLHRLTALAWLLGLAHGIAMGTDAGTLWFTLTLAPVALPALGLLAMRLAPRAEAAAS